MTPRGRNLTVWLAVGFVASLPTAAYLTEYLLKQRNSCVPVDFSIAMLTFDGLMVAVLALSFPNVLGHQITGLLSVPFIVSSIACLHVTLWAHYIGECGIGTAILNNQSLSLAVFFLLLGVMLWGFANVALILMAPHRLPPPEDDPTHRILRE